MRKTLNKKGFTLIELVVVIAIIGMVITTILSLLFFGYDVYSMTSTDFQLQSSVRVAMETLGETIRESKAVFAVPNADYKDEQWNYLTVDDAGTTVVAYEWNGTGWNKNVILGPYPDITFNIVFMKENTMSKDNSLEMYIEAKTKGGSVQRFAITTGYEVLNALQVIDYGTVSNPARALAYRSDEFHYENMKIYVNLSLVLDTSGSMTRNIAGSTTSNTSLRRISILKEKTNQLIEGFAQNANPNVDISISVVEYNTHANDPGNFLNVRTNKATLISEVNSLCGGTSQSCNGATNIGDGLRRAYYLTEEKAANQRAAHSDELDRILIKNYVLLLSDGDYTMYTRYVSDVEVIQGTRTCIRYAGSSGNCREWRETPTTYTYTRESYLGNQNVYYTDVVSNWWGIISNYYETNVYDADRPYIIGNGANLDTNAGYYIEDVAALGLNNLDNYNNFVIGFTPSLSGTAFNLLTTALNVDESRQFKAADADQLGLAFTNIQTSITNDTWHYLGPRLSE